MASIYEIIQGLNQAAANAYDGALTETGETLKAGLQREDGDPIQDKRVIDGFKVKFYGNMMCLSYHSEVMLREVYASGFESDMDQRLADLKGWLTKEYKNITGNSVSLSESGEIDVRVESTSRVRSWVVATKHYKIGGLSSDMNDDNSGSTNPVEAGWKTFLEQGGWGKRPPNDKRKKEK